jgi:hypothetical protein
MQYRQVKHHRLGQGVLLKKYNGGFEWEVRFPTGKQYRLFFNEFETDNHGEESSQFSDQFRNRRTLEALRMGIVPVENVKDLTIGLETEQISLGRALERTREHGGDAMAVVADYGFGKSHFIELAATHALE